MTIAPDVPVIWKSYVPTFKEPILLSVNETLVPSWFAESKLKDAFILAGSPLTEKSVVPVNPRYAL